MTDTVPPIQAAPDSYTRNIDRSLAEGLMRAVEDPASNGVPELHINFWTHADEGAREGYLSSFRNDPAKKAWYEDRYLAPEFDFSALGDLPEGSLGRGYYHHVVDNGLKEAIAADYADFHRQQSEGGALDGMPDEIQYATLRGFQTHDILHVLTGNDTSLLGELTLQAFGASQTGGTYNSLWLTIATTRMTLMDPPAAPFAMDAIVRGWRQGQAARPLAYERWEERFDQPIEQLRAEFSIPHA